jgi:hypothetical protein
MPRTDGAQAVAFLVTIGREGGELVVPLARGRNFVGRSAGGTRPYGDWPRPYAVEAAQWVVVCDAPSANVQDAASTNGSQLIPNGSSEAMALPHPNVAAETHAFELHEGDVLRTAYATFVFGWV